MTNYETLKFLDGSKIHIHLYILHFTKPQGTAVLDLYAYKHNFVRHQNCFLSGGYICWKFKDFTIKFSSKYFITVYIHANIDYWLSNLSRINRYIFFETAPFRSDYPLVFGANSKFEIKNVQGTISNLSEDVKSKLHIFLKSSIFCVCHAVSKFECANDYMLFVKESSDMAENSGTSRGLQIVELNVGHVCFRFFTKDLKNNFVAKTNYSLETYWIIFVKFCTFLKAKKNQFEFEISNLDKEAYLALKSKYTNHYPPSL
jgi:hypothetical protein